MNHQSVIREEELKNRVATVYFGRFDCTRIVGNIDFCVSPKRRDPRQMTFVPDPPILWAEAKNHPTDVHRMLAQLILTIGRAACPHAAADARDARPYHADEPPKFVGCFDNEKIAFVEYHYILPVFNLNDFNWTQTPSAVDDKTVETVRGVVPADKIVVFRFGADDAEIKSFIARNFTSGGSPALATPIDRNNFTFIYQKWRTSVMPHIDAPWDVLKKKYALYDRDFFLAEMNVDDNGTPEVADDRPAEDFYITFDANSPTPYTVKRKNEDELNFNLTFGFKANGGRGATALPDDGRAASPLAADGLSAYSAFWRRYKRPPKREYWDFIVSRLDLLVPQDVRERKGSFFTPAIWVEKSQQYIAAVLGENWQDEYYVWDCAGGTGNLEVGLTNKYRIWVSTLDQQDVDVMLERARNGANLLESHVFQFDFLNDSFDRLPQGLKEIIDDPEKRKRLVIYINPPYAEVSSKVSVDGGLKGKRGVNVTEVQKKYADLLGTASRELFAQFLVRIAKEMSGCIVGHFSKTKHLQGAAFATFRRAFRGTLESCFIVPADTFDNVKGKFPIGFFVGRLRSDGASPSKPGGNDGGGAVATQPFTSAVADVYDRDGVLIGTKTLTAYSKSQYINAWISRFRQKEDGAIGYMDGINGNDFQHNSIVYIINSKSLLPNPRGIWIASKNLVEVCVYLAVRHCVSADWLNDRDNFLVPFDMWADDAAFRSDCVIYTLFSDFNAIKSRYGANHWIPFTEEEVGAKDCFTSHFMNDFINGRAASPLAAAAGAARPPYQGELEFENVANVKVLPIAKSNDQLGTGNIGTGNIPTMATLVTPAARAVLDAGRELWRYYHAQPGANPNASYYDIRAHFQGCKPNGAMNAKSDDTTYNTLLSALRIAHKALAAQIEPKVYDYGFLKR